MRAMLRALALAWILAPLPALATQEGSWRDRYNRTVFTLNQDISDATRTVLDAIPESLHLPAAVQTGLMNLLQNTINEPLSALGHAVTGRYDLAGQQMRRVGINIVRGYGGVVDRATELGLHVPMIDIGLALCVRGVEAGPYVVLPVIGPRTTRDAAADVIVSNLVIYAMLVPIVGPLPSIGTFIIIEILDEFAALSMARSFDGGHAMEGDFETVREAYLERRARLCTEAASR